MPYTPPPHLVAWLREDVADVHLVADVARWVASFRQVHQAGPTWAQTARQVRPDLWGTDFSAADRRWYVDTLIRMMRRDGWLTFDNRAKGSLRPGKRLSLSART